MEKLVEKVMWFIAAGFLYALYLLYSGKLTILFEWILNLGRPLG